MHRRDFPGHAAWTDTLVNCDHVLAFVAIQPHGSDTDPTLHLVYPRTHFVRQCDAVAAAENALSKLLGIDEHSGPVFNSGDC